VQRKPITAWNILSTPAIFLGLAALLTLIAGSAAHSATLVVIALMMGCSAVLSFAASLGAISIPVLEAAFPVLSVSVVCGISLLVLSVEALRVASHWTLWTTLAAGVISIIGVIVAYAVKKSRAGGP